jgi:hypothetical protein
MSCAGVTVIACRKQDNENSNRLFSSGKRRLPIQSACKDGIAARRESFSADLEQREKTGVQGFNGRIEFTRTGVGVGVSGETGRPGGIRTTIPRIWSPLKSFLTVFDILIFTLTFRSVKRYIRCRLYASFCPFFRKIYTLFTHPLGGGHEYSAFLHGLQDEQRTGLGGVLKMRQSF